MRRLVDRAAVDISGRAVLELAVEAAAGSMLAEGLASVPRAAQPKLIVSASEYFPPSIALRSAMQQMRVPFVTLQHGAVNAAAAPFLADEYWVWTSRALNALRSLQPTGAVTVVGHPGDAETTAHDRDAIRSRLGISDSRTPVLVFFSQTHGLELSGATHFEVAAQLAAIRRLVPESLVVIKRHPSEYRSILETLCVVDERVIVAPEGLSAAELASAADVALALGSTALVDAVVAGCCAVEILCDESTVVESVAVERVAIPSAASAVVPLLSDAEKRDSLLGRQATWLRDSDTLEGAFDAACTAAARRVIAGSTSRATC